MTDRKFHKRVIKVTVLSEEVLPETLDLDVIHREITDGGCSGTVEWGPDRGLDVAKSFVNSASRAAILVCFGWTKTATIATTSEGRRMTEARKRRCV